MHGDLREAAQRLLAADAIVVTAGAGMGVDSGLPDFRGNEGFWRAYPPYASKGLSFVELANPMSFARDPAVGWGFYGHRHRLYCDTDPHEGFGILRQWVSSREGFVITSNVDGQFQKASFSADCLWEIHGSIHVLQCSLPCSDEVWPMPRSGVLCDVSSMRAEGSLPRCPHCGRVARPNILMFGDDAWVGAPYDAQQARWEAWLRSQRGPMVVVELGAGTAVPSIRHIGEWLVRTHDASLIRINPRESDGPAGTLSLPLGALAGLRALAAEFRP